MKEKLQILALVAEIAGSIAVVISLIVVAVELNQSTEQQRQNTLALQLSAYQEAEAVSQNFSAIRVQDREFNAIWQKFVSDPNSLTYPETSSATVYCTMIFNHGKLAYFQYQKGLLDEEQLNSLISPLTGLLRGTPIARLLWRGYVVDRNFDPAFVEHVQSRLGDVEWPTPASLGWSFFEQRARVPTIGGNED